MSFRQETNPTARNLKKFQNFDGTWNQYKEYLFDNNVLSINITRQDGFLRLRQGYFPE